MAWPKLSLTSLKFVEIDEEEADGQGTAHRPEEHLLGPVENEGPVGQVGQGIVQGQMAQLPGALVHQLEGHRPRPRQENEEQKEEDAGKGAQQSSCRRPGRWRWTGPSPPPGRPTSRRRRRRGSG